VTSENAHSSLRQLLGQRRQRTVRTADGITRFQQHAGDSGKPAAADADEMNALRALLQSGHLDKHHQYERESQGDGKIDGR